MWELARSEAHCTLLEWKESIYRQLLDETEELLQQVSEVSCAIKSPWIQHEESSHVWIRMNSS